MKLRILLGIVLVFCACSTPPSKNNGSSTDGASNNCKALPVCPEGTEEVEACGDEPECTTRQKCGTEVYCVPSTGIEAGDFDQSCDFDSDCVLINEGDPCECHVCPDAAISAGAQTEYDNAIAAAMCPEIACPAIACADEFLPHCVDGSCDLRKAKYVSVDEFDTSCETPDDCKAVFEGEVCAICGCANAAINVADADAYDAQFDVECNSGAVCDACPRPEVDCVAGVCQVGSN